MQLLSEVLNKRYLTEEQKPFSTETLTTETLLAYLVTLENCEAIQIELCPFA